MTEKHRSTYAPSVATMNVVFYYSHMKGFLLLQGAGDQVPA
jgi:hypothetical protein